jgi:ABC-type transport system substrate-binding protein
VYATQPDTPSRELIEVWKKCMDAVNIRMRFTFAKWPENLKSSNAGKLMMWGVAWLNTNPDGDTFLSLGYGPNKGQSNHARFDLPAFNAIYVKQRVMASTPERLALMKEAEKLMVVYAPYRASTHRIVTDMSQAWLLGYKRNPFLPDWWKFIDIDTTKLPK